MRNGKWYFKHNWSAESVNKSGKYHFMQVGASPLWLSGFNTPVVLYKPVSHVEELN